MIAEELRALAVGRRFIFAGLGSVTQATLPLMFEAMDVRREQVHIFAPDPVAGFAQGEYGSFTRVALTPGNYRSLLAEFLRRGDVLLNLASDVSSVDLMRLAREKGALYLDTVIEPWHGWYEDSGLGQGERTNYVLRERALAEQQAGAPTAVLTHGANPGLVSHFVKQAILLLARDKGLPLPDPGRREDMARTAQMLGVEAMIVSEYDSQSTDLARSPESFWNTWSVSGLIAEAGQPAELGWGTHEQALPADAHRHPRGCDAAIWLDKSGAEVKVRSWAPGVGAYHGFLITHNEAISLADWFTLTDNGRVVYRPTSFYAYRPCDAALASLHDMLGRGWQVDAGQCKVLGPEIKAGEDTVGVLLSLGSEGCFWYGSRLGAQQARRLNPHANATTLQVAAGVLGGLVWALKNPQAGVVEPEQMDSEWILRIARPWLGEVFGEYAAWTPADNQHRLFARPWQSSPWQFSNLRV